MASTIKEMQERFNLPDELEDAYEYKNRVVEEIGSIMEIDEYFSMRSKIGTVYSSCLSYEKNDNAYVTYNRFEVEGKISV